MSAYSDLPAVDAFLDELHNVQGRNPWMASCPVPTHGQGRGDKTGSLSVAEGDNEMPLINCKYGCGTNDVLDAVGLEWRDLYEERGW